MNDFIGRESRALADGESFSTGKLRFRYCRTPHLPHGWDAGVLFEETEKTLFCSDLFHQIGDVEPITSDDVVGRSNAQARFKKDEEAQKAFVNAVRLADVKAEDFDTVFYPGGHGPRWDLAEDPVSIALLESFYNSGKPIALVCHSPGVLRHVSTGASRW